ncbi:MAG: AbrB family transcriptional regulator [Cohaesibacteraceae bacterium]|nr:AbrB family transcriptional regulator [Cohaesibacteraceae bacterium]
MNIRLIQLSETFVWSVGGGVLALVAGVPAPFLIGGILCVSLAALCGREMYFPGQLRPVLFVLTGINIGSRIDFNVLTSIGDWPLSIAFLALSFSAIIFLSSLYLEKCALWDRKTAVFASLPGIFSYVVVIASDRGAKMGEVTLVHSIRGLLLIALVPLLLDGNIHIEQESISDFALIDGIKLVIASIIGGFLLEKTILPVPWLIGSIVASGLCYSFGFVAGQMPVVFHNSILVLLAALAGASFTGISFGKFLAIFRKAGVALAITFLVPLGFAVCGSVVLDQSIGLLFLAYAPGGLQKMVILAYMFDYDPVFVVGHHVLRFFALLFLAPCIARFVDKRS